MHHRHRRLTLYLNRDPIIDCELSGKAKIRHRNQNETKVHLVVLAVAGEISFTGVGSGTTRVPCGTSESYNCPIVCWRKFIFDLKTHHSRQLGGGHRKVAAELFLKFFLSILWSLFSSFYQDNNDLGQEYEQNEDHDPKMFMNMT